MKKIKDILGIIPAKSTSVRLPNKNVKILNGKPILAYTIKEALKVKEIAPLEINTDSEEIIKLGKKYGAIAPFVRPKYLAKNNTSTREVILHHLHMKKKQTGKYPQYFIILQPTSPLRKSVHIINAIDLFVKNNAQAVISVSQITKSLDWVLVQQNNNTIKKLDEKVRLIKKDSCFFPNGAIYIYNTKAYIKCESNIPPKTFPYIMSAEESIDLDTIDDYNKIKKLIK